MYILDEISEKRYEIKRSIFISYLVPIDKFETLYEKLKKEHPKANHIVWAYRKLNEFDQVVENSTDDAEPKGTAGPPALNVLRGFNVINTAVLIVRYFGGIKLGAGGLVRAYSNAAKEVLEHTDLLKYEKKVQIEFSTIYSLINRYEHFLNQYKIDYSDRVFDTNDVHWTLHLTQNEMIAFDNFRNSLY